MKKNILAIDDSAPMRRTRCDIMGNNQRGGEKRHNSHDKVVAIACSTGGPGALKEIIPYLPAEIDAPVLVVQHMPGGFTGPLAERLDSVSRVRVKEAQDGEPLKKGTVYIAPGGMHMILAWEKGKRVIKMADYPPRQGVKPSANIMFESLEKMNYERVICVVLTGMGSDGTEGIQRLKSVGRIHVIVQNEESCIVYGMPRAASGFADEILPLSDIAKAIIKKTGVLNDGR